MTGWPRFSLRALLVSVAVVAATLGLVVLPMQRQARHKRIRTALLTVGLAYHHCLSTSGSPPSKIQDLAICPCAGAAAITAIQSEGLVVFWNADVQLPDNGMYVLGYEKDVPKRGGLALMADGAVKHMTVGEFTGAPKAKTVPANPSAEE